ncbi:MAG: cupredoxin domain-containing protein [Actinomycetota bacterium]|nr:cupredoxin domain-containing protein [Actinomycetota bacterium]
MRIKSLLIAAIVILAAPVAAGCGADDNGDGGQAATPAPTTTPTTTPPPAASRALTVRMTEFAFDPKDAVAKGGKVTITVPNDGKVVHELVLLKTHEDPAKLPKKGDKVDESTSVGEIADVEPGSTKKATIRLAPGKYAMVCALPGHYEGGMYGSLTVE